MPGIVLSLVLIVGIAAGIAWPLFQRQRAVSLEADPDTTASASPKPRSLEQLCPHCSSMNTSNRTTCRECGGALPLDSFSGLFGGADKQETIRELIQAGLLLGGMIVVMLVSNWLPMPGKIAVIVGTLALLSFRLYKHVSGD